MGEILDYNAIKELGGKYANAAPSQPSECPSKNDVATYFSNVTVGGGVQSNELVTEADLTIQNTKYYCQWALPIPIKVNNDTSLTNYAHAYSYSYPEGNLSKKTPVMPSLNSLPTWVSLETTEINNPSTAEYRFYFRAKSVNTSTTERSAMITAKNAGATSSPIKIWLEGKKIEYSHFSVAIGESSPSASLDNLIIHYYCTPSDTYLTKEVVLSDLDSYNDMEYVVGDSIVITGIDVFLTKVDIYANEEYYLLYELIGNNTISEEIESYMSSGGEQVISFDWRGDITIDPETYTEMYININRSAF